MFDVCFFRFGNPAGSVIHEPTEDIISTLLIAAGPFLLNSLLCLVFCFPALVPVRVFDHAFSRLACRWLPRPTILHPYPNVRFRVAHPR